MGGALVNTLRIAETPAGADVIKTLSCVNGTFEE